MAWSRRAGGGAPSELDTDGAHLVIGLPMAGMLVTGLRRLPTGMWEVVFAVGAGRYLAPRCAALCQMAMEVTTGYPLILML